MTDAFKAEREGNWPVQPPKLTEAEQRVVTYLRASEYASERLIAKVCFVGPTAQANMTRVTEALERKGIIRRRNIRSPRYGVPSRAWEMVPGVPE